MIALAQKRRRKRNPMTEMVHGIAKRRTNKKNITKIEVEAKSVKRIDRESKKKERDLDKPKKMSKSRLNNLKKDRNQKIKIKADKKKSKEIEIEKNKEKKIDREKDNVAKKRKEKDQEKRSTKIAEIVQDPKKTKREGRMIISKKTTIVKTNTKDGEDRKMDIVLTVLQRVEMKVRDRKISTTWID